MTADHLEETEIEPVKRVREVLEGQVSVSADEVIETLSPSETTRAFLQLDLTEQSNLLKVLQPEQAAYVIENLPDESAADAIEELNANVAANILEELDSNDRADVLGEMDAADAEAVLREMDVDNSQEARLLLAYDDDTAGGLMMTEVFKFYDHDTVGTVLQQLSDPDSDFEKYRGQHPYIISQSGVLHGVVSLRSLLTSNKADLLSKIMADSISVQADAHLRDLRDIFDKHAFLGVPVIDDTGKLIGVVARESVSEAELEHAESEVQKLQGVVSEELRSMPTTLRARRRLSWLTINIFLNIIAASVIALYESTLAAVIALAVFLPIVSDMSGCSGNQAVAVSMRELSLGIVRSRDAFRVWQKEAAVGLINGLVLGCLIAIAAWMWKGNGYLGLVVGLALALNTLIAVSIGGTVPLLLTKYKVDPAIASGPMLTTITDMCGFFLVLSLATLMMPLLV